MDETAPKPSDSPGALRLALWAGLAPKIGLGALVVMWLVGVQLHEMMVAICGVVIFILGALFGVVGGAWTLLRGRTATVRMMGKAGVTWGIVILSITMALGSYVMALKQSHHERPFLKDGFHMVELRTAEMRCFKKHPDQEVSLQIIIEEKLSNSPDRLLQSSCSDRQASEPDFVNSPQSSDFILVPGFKNQNRTDAITVFANPAITFYKECGKVPVVFEDGATRTLSITDLEAQLKQQTGMTVAEIIQKQRSAP